MSEIELSSMRGGRVITSKMNWHLEALPEGGYELQAEICGEIVFSELYMKLPPTLTLDENLKLELEAIVWCLLGAGLANKIILTPELKRALVAEIKGHLPWNEWDS